MKFWVLSVGMVAAQASAQVLLDQANIEAWTEQEFVGTTQYEPVVDPEKGQVLLGRSNRSASGWGVEQTIDVAETPRLAWEWHVDQLPTLNAPEQSKAGDDYAARVYVIRKGSFGLLSTQSLVYVHSQERQVGDIWDSPYTGKVKMMAVSNGPGGQWQSFERDLAADWQQAFGKSLDELDAVAFMVDSDNSESQSAARFGQLSLQPK